MRLAIVLEDLRDRLAGGRLDLRVGIDERQSEAGGEPAPDRRLAAPHQADEHDRAVAEPLEEADDIVIAFLALGFGIDSGH